MARIDRSIWILFLSGTAATLAVSLLTGSWHAAAITAMLGLFAIAMLFDALERRVASVLANVQPPGEGGASEDELETLLQALPHPSLIVQGGRIERWVQVDPDAVEPRGTPAPSVEPTEG